MASSNDDNQGRAWPERRHAFRLLAMPSFPQLETSGNRMHGCRLERRLNRDLLRRRELTGLADPCFWLPLFVRARIGLNPERNVVHQATRLQDEM